MLFTAEDAEDTEEFFFFVFLRELRVLCGSEFFS